MKSVSEEGSEGKGAGGLMGRNNVPREQSTARGTFSGRETLGAPFMTPRRVRTALFAGGRCLCASRCLRSALEGGVSMIRPV